MRGPKPETLMLNKDESKELELLVRRHSTPQQLALRGRIILAAASSVPPSSSRLVSFLCLL